MNDNIIVWNIVVYALWYACNRDIYSDFRIADITTEVKRVPAEYEARP